MVHAWILVVALGGRRTVLVKGVYDRGGLFRDVAGAFVISMQWLRKRDECRHREGGALNQKQEVVVCGGVIEKV